MAEFAIRNLSVLDYAQGYTEWHYRAASLPLAKALEPGFFNPAADMIAAGDMIKISAANGGAMVFVHQSGQYSQGVMIEPMCATPSAGVR